MDDRAKTLVTRYGVVRAQYDAAMARMHQDCMAYSMPRKSNVTETKTPGSDDWTQGIYDDEAINGVQVLASGQLDWLFSGKWVDAESPWEDAPQVVKDWYKKAGEICLKVVNNSNFPLEIHEFLLDRSASHTAHLHCEEDEEDILFFMNDDVGEYVIEENHKGVVDKWWGCRKFTADQAVSKWGLDRVGKSVVEAFNQPEGKGRSTEFEFVFFIGPRPYAERLAGSKAPKDKPWALQVVQTKDSVMVEDGGYDEKPFFVSRYLKWGRSPYGYGPTMLALPIIRQINGLEKLMDVLCELQAFPRMLVPDDLEGMVGYGPSGVTIFNSATGSKPEEWATEGRYDIGKDRAESIRARIRRAYHVELFQMLTNIDEMKREKTATEVRAMLAEKISHFSPTFQRLRVEILKPLLDRVFAICYRKGLLPPLPVEILQFTGTRKLQFPRFEYTSKLAKAIKAYENMAWTDFMMTVGELFNVRPDVLEDEINFERAVRKIGDNYGVPVDMFNSADEKAAVRQQRQARQQAAEEMAMAEQASKTAKNLGGLPQMARLN